MIQQTFADIYTDELAAGAIINDRHTGHKEDYLILHCLIGKYKPKSFFEIGTNTGFGTHIICNAMMIAHKVQHPSHFPKVCTLDLPDEYSHKSQQHPLIEGKKGVGYECEFPFMQLRGDSRTFNYAQYPCEGYFCDAEHTYENVFAETKGMLQADPKIIIYHDADVPEVYQAIVDAMQDQPYDLYRVIDTRIAYALKKV